MRNSVGAAGGGLMHKGTPMTARARDVRRAPARALNSTDGRAEKRIGRVRRIGN